MGPSHEHLSAGVVCWFDYEGRVTGHASSVSVPAAAVVWRTDGHSAELAGAVGAVQSAAAENAA